jgi:hypothetical protein
MMKTARKIFEWQIRLVKLDKHMILMEIIKYCYRTN